jgi:AcrR family transcriptional regulator
VAACIALLVEEGRGAFSMRGVAAKLGISLGNLQYHFPTEGDLFAAVVSSVLTSSVQALEAEVGALTRAHDPVVLVDRLLMIHKDPTLSLLFFELWSIAARNPMAKAAMTQFYEGYVERVMQVLAAMGRPCAAPRARAIVALLEGTAVLAAGFGGRLSDSDWRAVRDAIVLLATPV